MSQALTQEIHGALQTRLDRLADRLSVQLYGRVRGLSLRFCDGGVILIGFAQTYHAKQLAQHAVMREVDLPIVANDIEVH
jgi:hypothetical protein